MFTPPTPFFALLTDRPERASRPAEPASGRDRMRADIRTTAEAASARMRGERARVAVHEAMTRRRQWKG